MYTFLKSTYARYPPKEILYRKFDTFSEQNFLSELSFVFNQQSFYEDYDLFESTFEAVLDKHAPLKRKYLRGNEKPHMNKALKKAIMKRSKFWNIYRKSKSSSDLSAYRKQRNLVTKMNKQAKKSHFQGAIDSETPKTFWQICKPFMSNKGHSKPEITIKQNGLLIHNSDEVAESLNSYYNNIAKSLSLFQWNQNLNQATGTQF